MRLLRTLACLVSTLVLQAALGPGFASTEPIHLLVEVDGNVELKRNGWSRYANAHFGSFLQPGDLIRTDDDARAVVLCGDLSLWRAPPGLPAGVNNGCPPAPRPALVHEGSLLGPTRGRTDPLLPYIVTPRRTALLDPRPLLRWNPLGEGTSYKVQVVAGGVVWEAETDKPEIRYPGAPPLEVSRTYLLLVEASDGTSSREDRTPSLGFRLLGNEERARVRSELSAIDVLPLSAVSKRYARARLFIGRRLLAEAALELEGEDLTHAVFDLARAKIDLQIGLIQRAERHARAALSRSEQELAPELIASAQLTLATIYELVGELEQALEWLEKARAAFEALGSVEDVERIDERIARLSP